MRKRGTKQRMAITGGVALTTLAVGLAGMGSAAADDAGKGPASATIKIKRNKHSGFPLYKGPKTIPVGGQLQILNKTEPSQIGPHTFSIVTKEALPKNERQRVKCGKKNNRKLVCKDIAEAHEMDGLDAGVPSVDTGAPVMWDTPFDGEGAVGDSWYSNAKDESETRAVPATPTKLYYMCIIWPTMQGKLKVEAPG